MSCKSVRTKCARRRREDLPVTVIIFSGNTDRVWAKVPFEPQLFKIIRRVCREQGWTLAQFLSKAIETQLPRLENAIELRERRVV